MTAAVWGFCQQQKILHQNNSVVGWGGVVAEQEQLDMKGGVSVELYWHLRSFFMHHEININSINQSV